MKETVGSPGPFQPFHAFIHGVLAGMFFLPSRLETRVVGPKGQSERLVFIGLPLPLPQDRLKTGNGQGRHDNKHKEPLCSPGPEAAPCPPLSFSLRVFY